MDDEMEYIYGLHNNNSTIIQKIYDEYFSLVKTFIIRNNGDEYDAWDIFQEGLILILKKSKKPDFELKSQFSTFLYGCCRNLWRNELRGKRRTEVTIVDTMTYIDEYSIEKDLHQKAQLILYKEKFNLLGAKCQEVLKLYFTKTSMKKIAQLVNLAGENAAKQRRYKCAQQLIKKIRDDYRYQELKYEN